MFPFFFVFCFSLFLGALRYGFQCGFHQAFGSFIFSRFWGVNRLLLSFHSRYMIHFYGIH